MKLTFHDGAGEDIREAWRFYEQERSGLGGEFLRAIAEIVKSLQDYPGAGRRLPGRSRSRLLPRFPYRVVYQVTATELRIIAVAHHRRRPGYWRGRR